MNDFFFVRMSFPHLLSLISYLLGLITLNIHSLKMSSAACPLPHPSLKQQPSLSGYSGRSWPWLDQPHSFPFLWSFRVFSDFPIWFDKEGNRTTWITVSDVWREFVWNGRGQLRKTRRRGSESPAGVPVSGSHQPPWGLLQAWIVSSSLLLWATPIFSQPTAPFCMHVSSVTSVESDSLRPCEL